MGVIVLFIFYGSILFCIVASIRRAVAYAAAPLHLRWELYRGSSVYELPDGWNRANLTLGDKLKSLFLDVFFLREVYHRNRRFWCFLYLFHVGLYLLIAWHGWLFIRAVAGNTDSASRILITWGHVASGLAFLGGIGILILRSTDFELKVHSTSLQYVKWVFLLLTLLGAFYAVDVHFRGDAPALLKYVKEQVTFQSLEHKLHPSPAPACHVLLASVWLLYLPFSHMMLLFFRYYHHLRWDDVPNRRGSLIENRARRLLGQSVSWSAPHIQTGKSWAQVAGEVRDQKRG
jgi:nitrate reductase gamma subunit